MLYHYDNAIVEDIIRSLNLGAMGSKHVKVMDPDQGLKVIAQAENDNLKFPLILLTRYPDTPIDKSRMNFTRTHKGVAAVVNPETNELYYEKAIPVELQYDLTVLATNSADRDELIRELIFKYTDMYFITFTLPYEAHRRVRFGVRLDFDKEISSKSGVLEYLNEGTLYQSIISLKCEGCVLVSYTPAKLQRVVYDNSIGIESPSQP